MSKPITHFVVTRLDNGDFQVHVEAGVQEYVGDFTISLNETAQRKPGGNYQKADRCVAGEPPFTFTIGVQQIPAGPTYPECFGVFDKDHKIVAWLTEKQVRESLEKFDAIAIGKPQK
jgi:hypothetical protein